MTEQKNIIHRSSIKNLSKLIYSHDINTINIENISIIFSFNNYYLQYFLFINNINKDFQVTFSETSKIIKMINKIKKNNFLYVEKNIINFLKSNIANFKDISGILSILSICNVNDKNDLDFFRKYFGYNLIYKNYKSLLKMHSLHNLPLILRLLQNNKICYNKILEIYKKLNFYLDNKILDNGFVFCCSFFYYLLDYQVHLLDDTYKDFLSGFCVYLFEIIIDYKSYDIFKLEDIQVLVNLINLLYNLSNERFKLGFYKKTLEKTLELLTDIFEDQVKLTFLLQILLVELNEKQIYFDVLKTIHDSLNRMTLSSFSITFSEHEFINENFLIYKYKTLDKLKEILKLDYNKVDLYNDLFNNDKYNSIILNNINIPIDFIIDNLIILINNSRYKIQFIDFILKYGNTTYMYLYLSSIKDDYKVILLFVQKFTSYDVRDNYVEFDSNENKCTIEKYAELLILIYFKFISINNLFIKKSRVYLIRKILSLKTIIKFIINELKKNLYYNDNIILLLYFVIQKEKDIEYESMVFLFIYLTTVLKNFKREGQTQGNKNIDILHEKIEFNYFEYKVFSCKLKTENLLINMCVDLLERYKNKNKFDLITEFSYYNIIILTIYSKIHKQEFDFLIKKILDFVFLCNKKERKTIYKLYSNHKKSKFLIRYKNKIKL